MINKEAFKFVMVNNVAIFASVALCTASIALFAHSAEGLWSMIMCLGVHTYSKDKEEI